MFGRERCGRWGVFACRVRLGVLGLFVLRGIGIGMGIGMGIGIGDSMVGGVAHAQILNTLRGWEETEPGFSGDLGVSFSVAGGNTEVLSLAGAGRIQWLTGRERFRLLGNVLRAESDGTKTAQAASAHLRHNHEVTRWFSTLAFVQVQENPFQRLQSRWLFGAGGRFDLVRREEWDLSIGLAHMFEVERIEDVDGREEEHRLSSFVSWSGDLSEHVEVDVIGFLQPLWEELSDKRAVINGSLSVGLVGSLSLVQSASYQYDSRPPEDVGKEDWGYRSGLEFEL